MEGFNVNVFYGSVFLLVINPYLGLVPVKNTT